MLRDYLVQSGFQTHRLDRGDEVEDWVLRNGAEVVLLDLMLPGKGGLEVCKGLRTFSNAAIIMITAKVEEIDACSAWSSVRTTTSASRSAPARWWRG